MAIRVNTRRGWFRENPILNEAEFGYEKETKKLKIGDGVTAWQDLAYYIDPEVVPVSEGGGSAELPDWLADDPHRGLQAVSPQGVVALQDEATVTGLGNGIFWNSGDADGDVYQGMDIAVGPAEDHHTLSFKGDGVLTLDGSPVGGISTPLTREQLEATLYDTVYSWELQPGSDTPGDRISPWTKLPQQDGVDYWLCLVSFTSAQAGSGTGYDGLAPATTPWTFDAIDNVDALPGPVAAGTYLAFWSGTGEPSVLPPGWLPVEGPKFLGAGGPGLSNTNPAYLLFAGKVSYSGGPVFEGDTGNWWLAPIDTAVNFDAVAVSDGFFSGADASVGEYLGVWGGNATTYFEPMVWPEGWTPLTSVVGPIAITDENAGGVIDDIAYVVSGYLYNSTETYLVENPEKYKGVLVVNDSDITVQTGDVFAINGGADKFYVTSNGLVGMTTDGFSPSSTASYGINAPTSYWPYLERFDLATKKWLPRIKLPLLNVEELVAYPELMAPSGSAWDGTRYQLAGSWPGGDLPAPPTEIHNSYYWVTAAGQPFLTGAMVDASWVDNSGIPHPTAAVGPGDLYLLRTDGGSPLPPPPAGVSVPQPKYYASEGGFAGVIDGKLYFGGGDGDDLPGSNLFFSYDPETQVFERLPDLPSIRSDQNDFPDYNAYGIVGDALWLVGVDGTHVAKWTVADDWERFVTTGDNVPSDQLQGLEIAGKLYFVSDRIYVFDPIALTIEAKASTPMTIASPCACWLVEGNLFIATRDEDSGAPVYLKYTTSADSWSDTDSIGMIFGEYSVSAVYDDVPYLLSGVDISTGYSYDYVDRGVYGLTGVTLEKPLSQRLDELADAAAIKKNQPVYLTMAGSTVIVPLGSKTIGQYMYLPATHLYVKIFNDHITYDSINVMILTEDETDYATVYSSAGSAISTSESSPVALVFTDGTTTDILVFSGGAGGADIDIKTPGMYFVKVEFDNLQRV